MGRWDQFKRLISPGETFAAKIFVVIIVLVLVLSAAFTGFFVRSQWLSHSAALNRQGEVLAKLLAYTARLGVFAENPDLARDPVQGVLQNSEVVSVILYNANGKVLLEKRKAAGEPRAHAGHLEGRAQRELFARIRKSEQVVSREGPGKILEFWAPIQSDPARVADDALFFSDTLLQPADRTIGYVQVGLDKGALETALINLLVNSVFIAVLVLVTALVAAILLVKGITGPLNRLTRSVRAMGECAPLAKVPIETNDEIGKLACAFNEMADSLQKREAEKAHLESQLRQAHKMEAIGTLAGGIAHDFNNILSTIEGYAVLLREALSKKSQVRSYVDQIAAAAERGADLTRRLLAFSKNQVINPAPVDINGIIRRIKPLLDRFVGENIELRVQTSSEELVVLADELHMEQTLINIVTNSRDAMCGGGVIEIVAESVEIGPDGINGQRQLLPGSYAKLQVSDSGQGIDSSVMERIFDPFFTTKEVGKGTGLGLSMAYGIVKQHKGTILVESRPGHGAVFSIYLPLVASVVERKRLARVLLPEGNRETILLAEDDRFVRMLTKHILTKYGYHVIEAVDGEDALIKLHEHSAEIRLLLLDVIMPKKNGKEVFEEARKIHPNIRSVFMTGHPFDVISSHGLSADDLVVIAKPLTPGELLMRVREVLDESLELRPNGLASLCNHATGKGGSGD